MVKEIPGKKKSIWVTEIDANMDNVAILALAFWCSSNFDKKCEINIEDGLLECMSEDDAIKYEKEYDK